MNMEIVGLICTFIFLFTFMLAPFMTTMQGWLIIPIVVLFLASVLHSTVNGEFSFLFNLLGIHIFIVLFGVALVGLGNDDYT